MTVYKVGNKIVDPEGNEVDKSEVAKNEPITGRAEGAEDVPVVEPENGPVTEVPAEDAKGATASSKSAKGGKG